MEQTSKAEQEATGDHLDPGDVSELEMFYAETDDQKKNRCSRDGCERQGFQAQCAKTRVLFTTHGGLDDGVEHKLPPGEHKRLSAGTTLGQFRRASAAVGGRARARSGRRCPRTP